MSELTRQERFSKSLQFAKALVADSIITDATAQFLALIIREIHDTKIAPLQAELKRRADLPPTLSAARQLPEVRALVDAIKRCPPDRPQMTDAELRAAVNEWWCLWARPALAAIKEPKT